MNQTPSENKPSAPIHRSREPPAKMPAMGSTNQNESPREVLIGGVEKREIVIRDYDPQWPEVFKEHAAVIRAAIKEIALAIEHIGSTAVPGLAAKPIVDVLLVAPDSADEGAYLTKMETAGYVLRVREPDFHEHRMFRTRANRFLMVRDMR
jgi:GrpB-like predicted nucleotidyltransferase (UPF0157 family)